MVYQAQIENTELDEMVVALIMQQSDPMPSERFGSNRDRFESIISYNFRLVPIFTTHEELG